MSTCIFVEGDSDRRLVTALLEDIPKSVKFQIITANGINAIRPIVRKTLITKHAPSVLIVDADTNDNIRAANQLRELNDYLAWGSDGVPYKVIQFTPQIEVLFFENPSVLSSLAGKEIAPEIQTIGKIAPRQILHALLPEVGLSLIVNKLLPSHLIELRKNPLIEELREFVFRHAGDGENG